MTYGYREHGDTLYQVEVTDCFGGEPNYSWVMKKEVRASRFVTQRELIRRAKAAVGWTGVSGTTTDFGDYYEFRPPVSYCQVMFVMKGG